MLINKFCIQCKYQEVAVLVEDRGKYLPFVLFLNPLPIVHVGNYFSIWNLCIYLCWNSTCKSCVSNRPVRVPPALAAAGAPCLLAFREVLSPFWCVTSSCSVESLLPNNRRRGVCCGLFVWCWGFFYLLNKTYLVSSRLFHFIIKVLK